MPRITAGFVKNCEINKRHSQKKCWNKFWLKYLLGNIMLYCKLNNIIYLKDFLIIKNK